MTKQLVCVIIQQLIKDQTTEDWIYDQASDSTDKSDFLYMPSWYMDS